MSELLVKNGIVEDLGAIMGYTAASTLIDYRGGTSLYVPKTESPEHLIARLVGLSAMRALCREYGDSTINLPIDYRRERSVRNRLIGGLLIRNVSPKDIAAMAGISTKLVILARNELESLGLVPYMVGSEKIFMVDDGRCENPHGADAR